MKPFRIQLNAASLKLERLDFLLIGQQTFRIQLNAASLKRVVAGTETMPAPALSAFN